MDPFKTAYTEEQLAEVRKAIRHQLQQHGTAETVQKLLAELQMHEQAASVKPDTALKMLKDRGVVEQLTRSIAPPPLSVASVAAATAIEYAQRTSSSAPGSVSQVCQYLHIKALGARAVMEYVARPAVPGEMLRLSLELLGHRLDTPWVPACSEPTFSGEIMVPLPATPTVVSKPKLKQAGTKALGSTGSVTAVTGDDGRAADQDSAVTAPDPLVLLGVRQPLHLVMVSTAPVTHDEVTGSSGPTSGIESQGGVWPNLECSSSPVQVVASGQGDWRTALLRKKAVTVCVQLGGGPGQSLGIPAGTSPAGLVTLQMSIKPSPAAPVDEAVLQVQQRSEASRDSQCASSFLTAAKAWWAEYVRKSPDFRTRPVKVLARGEDGSQYPVTSFVRPLQLGRALPTARHAARFVSLLQRRDMEQSLDQPGATTSPAAAAAAECWCSLHTILASRSGSSEDLAVLLCGLLLGFGQDAYVAVGRLRNGCGHVWVITRAAYAETTHWEPATGVRYSPGNAEHCPFLCIGSVFNHKGVWANCQENDHPMSVSYLLEEPSCWQSLEVNVADVPGPGWSAVQLRLPRDLQDTFSLEYHLEIQLKSGLASHRLAVLRAAMLERCHEEGQHLEHEHGNAGGDDSILPLVWDESLEHLLMPALEAYEHEAITGDIAPGSVEFQTSIKRCTPQGWVFKGVPHQHRHLHAMAILQGLLDDPQAVEVLFSCDDIDNLLDGPQHDSSGSRISDGDGATGGVKKTKNIGPRKGVQGVINAQAVAAKRGVLALRAKLYVYPEGVVSTWVMLACKTPAVLS